MGENEAAKIVAGLFESSYSGMVRFAARRAGNIDVAEDLVQDALLELYRALCDGKSIQQPKQWTLVVLQRKIYKELRERFSGATLETLDVLDALPAGPGTAHAEVTPGEVNRLLALLTPREHEVVLLRMESLKYREIAKALDISKSAVNALIARALRKLKAATDPDSRNNALLLNTDQDDAKTLQ